jgi:hypothetical protein
MHFIMYFFIYVDDNDTLINYFSFLQKARLHFLLLSVERKKRRTLCCCSFEKEENTEKVERHLLIRRLLIFSRFYPKVNV